jgi:hypothetical protein
VNVPVGRLDLMANVIICSAAEVDYTESLTWYSERNVNAANDFDAEFDRALSKIAADPECFRYATFGIVTFFCVVFRFASSIESFATMLS